MKTEEDLSRWDLYRRLVKQGKIQHDAIIQCIQMNFELRELEEISSILNREYGGKKVYPFLIRPIVDYPAKVSAQFEFILSP